MAQADHSPHQPLEPKHRYFIEAPEYHNCCLCLVEVRGPISQSEMAIYLGVTRQAVSYYEKHAMNRLRNQRFSNGMDAILRDTADLDATNLLGINYDKPATTNQSHSTKPLPVGITRSPNGRYVASLYGGGRKYIGTYDTLDEALDALEDAKSYQ